MREGCTGRGTEPSWHPMGDVSLEGRRAIRLYSFTFLRSCRGSELVESGWLRHTRDRPGSGSAGRPPCSSPRMRLDDPHPDPAVDLPGNQSDVGIAHVVHPLFEAWSAQLPVLVPVCLPLLPLHLAAQSGDREWPSGPGDQGRWPGLPHEHIAVAGRLLCPLWPVMASPHPVGRGCPAIACLSGAV